MATLKLRDMLGSNVRSRANARKIYAKLDEDRISQIDLSGVEFVSRSVADEFCIIMEERKVVFVNETAVVGNMIRIVREGRGQKRNLSLSSDIVECRNMEELEAAFLTM